MLILPEVYDKHWATQATGGLRQMCRARIANENNPAFHQENSIHFHHKMFQIDEMD